MKRIMPTTMLVFLCAAVSGAQEMPAEYKNVVEVFGRGGDYKAGVLKVNVPRNDIHVSVAGMALPTAFGFGGWVAFT